MDSSSPSNRRLALLSVIHRDIDRCRECEPFADGYSKPVGLERGDPGRIVIVGQGPGASEVQLGKAFSGQSGTTLDRWLVQCGADPGSPRRGIYFTALIKCRTSATGKQFESMVKNCHGFLERQLEAIRPELIITLGQKSYEYMRFSERTYNKALCQPLKASESLLFAPQGFDYTLMPWPHPSGLNRWLNEQINKRRLEKSFDEVSRFITRDS